mmetsp:Transcript_33771/g.62726  ORF Transcript_33771/g.62726 Transcript_33771/m.62726 type:complete len:307 (-) Transcript_33771:250-1170(-)
MHVPPPGSRHLRVEQPGGFREVFFRLPPPSLQLLCAVDLNALTQPNVGVVVPMGLVNGAVKVVFVPVREHSHPSTRVGGGTIWRALWPHVAVAQRAHKFPCEQLVKVCNDHRIVGSDVIRPGLKTVACTPLPYPSTLHHARGPVGPCQLLVHAPRHEILGSLVVKVVRHVTDLVEVGRQDARLVDLREEQGLLLPLPCARAFEDDDDVHYRIDLVENHRKDLGLVREHETVVDLPVPLLPRPSEPPLVAPLLVPPLLRLVAVRDGLAPPGAVGFRESPRVRGAGSLGGDGERVGVVRCEGNHLLCC